MNMEAVSYKQFYFLMQDKLKNRKMKQEGREKPEKMGGRNQRRSKNSGENGEGEEEDATTNFNNSYSSKTNKII